MINFPGVRYKQELLSAIDRQLDDFSFVLDRMLAKHELTASMAAYWEVYKLKIIMEYLNAFTSALGINFLSFS